MLCTNILLHYIIFYKTIENCDCTLLLDYIMTFDLFFWYVNFYFRNNICYDSSTYNDVLKLNK